MSVRKVYLAELDSVLRSLEPRRRREILAEIAGHLEDRAAGLRAQGFDKEASMSEAINRVICY